MKKLRSNNGMTLIELLVAILIILLSTAAVGVGVRLAMNSYRSCMEASQAQMLCSTLTTDMSDKLRFCGTVEAADDGTVKKIFIQNFGDEGGYFSIDSETGRLKFGDKDVIGSGAYPRGLKLKNLSMSYNKSTNIFSVSFDIVNGNDEKILSQAFEVKKINN